MKRYSQKEACKSLRAVNLSIFEIPTHKRRRRGENAGATRTMAQGDCREIGQGGKVLKW